MAIIFPIFLIMLTMNVKMFCKKIYSPISRAEGVVITKEQGAQAQPL
jgi:hypothetical protein